MRVFVTGATGFIGSAVVKELISSGHTVVGLARSNAAAQKLATAGAGVLRGEIEDLEILRKGASGADGVIHLAFYHEIGHMPLGTRLKVMLGGSPSGIVGRYLAAAVGSDRRAIETMGDALSKGTAGRPLIAALGTMILRAGVVATEDDEMDPGSVGGPRGETEKTIAALASRGVRAMAMRLAPVVHDTERAGLISMMIPIAKKKGVSAYVGDGLNRWQGVHVRDAARLFKLALEKGQAGARYHAVAGESVTLREIAEVIGRRLKLPVKSISQEEAAKQFSWLAAFVGTDNPVSSRLTQERLGWRPTGPGLMEDLNAMKALEA